MPKQSFTTHYSENYALTKDDNKVTGVSLCERFDYNHKANIFVAIVAYATIRQSHTSVALIG